MEKQFTEEQIKQSGINALVKYLESIRVNFSEQSEQVINKIKNGGSLTDADIYILTNTDQEKINNAVHLEDINQRMQKGRTTKEDVDFLINYVLGDISDIDLPLRQGLYQNVINRNYHYALNHKDEFSEEEFNRLEELSKQATVQEVIKNSLHKNNENNKSLY